jgi:hypothetical protein
MANAAANQPIISDPELNDPASLQQLRKAWFEAVDELSAAGGGEIFLHVDRARADELVTDMLLYAMTHGVAVRLGTEPPVVLMPPNHSKDTNSK